MENHGFSSAEDNQEHFYDDINTQQKRRDSVEVTIKATEQGKSVKANNSSQYELVGSAYRATTGPVTSSLSTEHNNYTVLSKNGNDEHFYDGLNSGEDRSEHGESESQICQQRRKIEALNTQQDNTEYEEPDTSATASIINSCEDKPSPPSQRAITYDILPTEESQKYANTAIELKKMGRNIDGTHRGNIAREKRAPTIAQPSQFSKTKRLILFVF